MSVILPAQIGFDLAAVVIGSVVHASRFSVLGSCSRSVLRSRFLFKFMFVPVVYGLFAN
jgi:hypothetical protein